MSLSERIAALNKAKATPQLSPQANTVKLPGSSGVREKAARFDGLGAAPAPRGSFGLGAPMSSSQKSNRELWGNRIPSVNNRRGGGTPSSVGSRSPSRSRKSSNEGIVPTGTPDPLTEEAVGSLGAAVLVNPAAPDASTAFRSIAASVVDDRNDASSSVAAVEAEDDLRNRSMLDVSINEDTGRVSPALSNSTVSDSALKEAPPILSPAASSAQLFTPPARSIYDPVSVAATEGSSNAPTLDTPSTVPVIDTTPVSDMSALNLSSSTTSMSSEAANAPLPLSTHLLQSLQANMPSRGSASGMDTPKSVMVETGSTDGNAKLDDLDVPDDEAMGDASSTGRSAAEEDEAELDLKSEKGVDDGDLDIQPGLRIGAPVLPLSSAHLKSLNVQSSLNRAALASGLQTPRSMVVEDGSDGSGRRSPMVTDDHYGSGVVIELPSDAHPSRGEASPAPLSPAVLAYALGDSPAQSHPPGDAGGSSLRAPHADIDMSTPVAQQLLLPDVETPSSASRPNPLDVDHEPQTTGVSNTATVRGPSADLEAHKADRSLPQFNGTADNGMDTSISSL